MISHSKTGRPKRDILGYRILDHVLRVVLRALPVWKCSERVALWWGTRFRPAPRLVRLRSGAFIHVDPTDYLQLLIYYLGTFEPHCLPYLLSCGGKGATIIDVGANIGLYTLESAFAVGPTGRVISIEAAPSNVQVLKKNIEHNRLNNISLIEVAVGDLTGCGTLTLAKGGNRGMFTLGSTAGDSSYNVEIRRIDDLIEEKGITSVDLIKMDIEGSEYHALRGALRTLQRCRPTILIELNEAALRQCQSSAAEVKALLSDLGYRGWVIGRKGLRLIRTARQIHDCDECLFVHSDNTSLIRKLGQL